MSPIMNAENTLREPVSSMAKTNDGSNDSSLTSLSSLATTSKTVLFKSGGTPNAEDQEDDKLPSSDDLLINYLKSLKPKTFAVLFEYLTFRVNSDGRHHRKIAGSVVFNYSSDKRNPEDLKDECLRVAGVEGGELGVLLPEAAAEVAPIVDAWHIYIKKAPRYKKVQKVVLPGGHIGSEGQRLFNGWLKHALAVNDASEVGVTFVTLLRDHKRALKLSNESKGKAKQA